MVNNVRDTANEGKSPICQISLLQGLTYGDYYGSVTIKELKELGDTGKCEDHRQCL